MNDTGLHSNSSLANLSGYLPMANILSVSGLYARQPHELPKRDVIG